MAKLELVEGIGNLYASQLRRAGIRSTRSLLEKGATPRGRDEIAKAAGISGKLILESLICMRPSWWSIIKRN